MRNITGGSSSLAVCASCSGVVYETGSSLIEEDDAGADGLLQSVRALRLLGTRGVLVGVRP